MFSKPFTTPKSENLAATDDSSYSSSTATLTQEESAERLRIERLTIRKAKHAEATKRKDKENKKKQRIMDHAK
jgi:hypothetical protein